MRAGFLKVFAHFRNPQGLYRGEQLFDLFWRFVLFLHRETQEATEAVFRLLANADATVQGLALNCLMVWKPSYLKAYVKLFQQVIDEKTLREALVRAWVSLVGKTDSTS